MAQVQKLKALRAQMISPKAIQILTAHINKLYGRK